MKKIVFITFMILNISFAQRMQLGICGGINFSFLTGNIDYMDFLHSRGVEANTTISPGVGCNAAITLDYFLWKHLSVQTGIRFTYQLTKGYKNFQGYVPLNIIPNNRFMILHSYLCIPLKFKWYLKKIPNLYLHFGSEWQFLTYAGKTEYMHSDSYHHEITDILNRRNLAGNIGSGLIIPTAYHTFFIELCYSHGFISPVKNKNWNSNWKTNEIYLNFGILYDLF